MDPDLEEAALGLLVSEILPVFVKVKTLFYVNKAFTPKPNFKLFKLFFKKCHYYFFIFILN